MSLGAFGVPGLSLGGSLKVLGVPGGAWEIPGGPWESVGGPWVFLARPRDQHRIPGTPQGASLHASVGAMGGLKNNEKPLVFIAFQDLGGPREISWGVRGGALGVPEGFLGVSWVFLGGSEASLEGP